jgi:hypothetical protein
LLRRPPLLSRARVGKNGSNPILEQNRSRCNSPNRTARTPDAPGRFVHRDGPWCGGAGKGCIPTPPHLARRGASRIYFGRACYLAGVKNPVTVPERVNVPSGVVNVFSAAGSSQVTAFLGWCALADVSVSDFVVPPAGVNENVTLNAVGMKTAVLPSPADLWLTLDAPPQDTLRLVTNRPSRYPG